MCGRFTLRTPLHRLAEQFLFDLQNADVAPRFNIAPSQPIAAVRVLEPGQPRQLTWLHWGLIPAWAKDRAIANRLINARGETVAEKPSFRAAFEHRRCLILSDGYYEWQKLDSPGKKQPYYIQRCDRNPFAFAGLWETWRNEAGAPVETCTIITTNANALTRSIHHRMPVILNHDDYASWLDPGHTDRESLQSLLRPYDSADLEAYPVSTLVNSPRMDSPECIEPWRPPHTDESRPRQLDLL
ncbi:MAG: SOS response-associated peptidase [Pirellulaceae bacterium]